MSAYLTLACALALLYAVTLAPNITWIHDGADGGDLIAAAMSNGVAHPSGYPLYLLLLKTFLWLPLGNPAWRANIFSAVCAIGSALVVCELVNGKKFGGVGLLAGFAWGVSGLLWSQAVIAEVYTLHLFLLVLNLCVLRSKNFWVWGLAVGLALSNHLTSIFLLPLHLGALLYAKPESNSIRRWLYWFGGLFIGLTPYALLPFWASQQPPINWGGANTVDGLRWLIMGEAYQGLLGGASAAWLDRLQTAAAMLIDQFGLIGFALILLGIFWGRESNWGLGWLSGSAIVFALLYNTRDAYLYLLPAFLACALWLGRGLKVLLRQEKNLRTITVSVVWVALFWHIIPTMRWADASQDLRAAEFMLKVLQTAPLNAKIVTVEDRDSFTLWYAREALGARRDVQIVVAPLERFSWYQATLAYTAQEKMAARVVCYTQLDSATALVCK